MAEYEGDWEPSEEEALQEGDAVQLQDEGDWVETPQQPQQAQSQEGEWVETPTQANQQSQEGEWVETPTQAQGDLPEAEGGIGSTLRRAAHNVIPGLAGLAGFAATAPFGGPLVGIGAGIGAAGLAATAQEKLAKMFGFDDEPQQQANQLAHPWYSAAGDVLGMLPGLGVGTEAALGMRTLGAGIAGVTDYIMGGDPQHALVAAAGGALLNKPTQLGESVMGYGEQAGQKLSSMLARSKAGIEGAANIATAPQQAAEQNIPTPPPADGDVRFYHGGDDPTSGGSRWVTTDPTYARDFRSDGIPKDVHYVDIPKGDPAEVGMRSWDEQTDQGTNAVGRYHSGEIPEALAQKLQPYRPEPSADAIQTPTHQGPSSQGSAGTAAEMPGPLTKGKPPSEEEQSQVTRSKREYGNQAADEVSPPIREAGEVPPDVQAALEVKRQSPEVQAGGLPPGVDAPVPSYLAENRANAVKAFAGTPVESKIVEMARAGNTAKEIAAATGVEVNTIRFIRDHHGIAAVGPQMSIGMGRMPSAKPPDTQGGMPFVMTNEMKRQLAEAGHSPEQISNMTPGQAHEILAAKAPPAEPPEISMLKQQAANRTMAAERTGDDVLKGPLLNEEGGTPSPELNEATRYAVNLANNPELQAVHDADIATQQANEARTRIHEQIRAEADQYDYEQKLENMGLGGMRSGGKPPPPEGSTLLKGGGKPPPPPKEPPIEPTPPERYTGGKFDTPLNAANTVNNALDNTVRQGAGLWQGFRQLLRKITNEDSSLMGKAGGDISRAIERGTFDQLDPKVQDAFNKHLGPIRDNSTKVAAELDRRGLKPADDDMAPNYIMHTRKMPFSLKEALNNDPTGMIQGMKNPTNFKGLEYRGAVADDGSRLSIHDVGDKYTVGKNGEETFFKKPEFDDGPRMFKNGDKIEYNGKEYTIDRGIQDEITRDFRDEKGRPIEYHQNAILSELERNSQLNAALDYDNMMRTFKTDPALDPYRVKADDIKAAQLEKAGWQRVDSPGFENILMHPDMAQAIKNNFEPGMFKANPITNFTRAMNQFAVRSIFWNPVPHSLNGLVHYIVARGSDWLPLQFKPGSFSVSRVTLDNYRDLMNSLTKAWDTVVNQGPDLVKLNNAGLPLVWSSIERTRAHELTGKLLGVSLRNEPKFWGGMANRFGLGTGVDAVRAVYEGSAKTLWMATDLLTAARYYELTGRGMGSDEAISHMAIHMPDYRPALSLFGVRGLPSAMGDSVLPVFGRYHAGMLRSYEGMVMGALGKNSTVDQRRDAFGNIAALYVMGAIVMPMLDKLAQTVTGNDKAEVKRRGPLTLAQGVIDAVKGTKQTGQTLSSVLTMSPGATQMVDLLRNKDYSGSTIIQPASPFYAKAGQFADYLARTMISPYNTAAKIATNPKGPGVVSSLAQELTDTKVPTARQTTGRTKALNRTQKDAVYRYQHPKGLIESTLNKFTPQPPRGRPPDAP